MCSQGELQSNAFPIWRVENAAVKAYFVEIVLKSKTRDVPFATTSDSVLKRSRKETCKTIVDKYMKSQGVQASSFVYDLSHRIVTVSDEDLNCEEFKIAVEDDPDALYLLSLRRLSPIVLAMESEEQRKRALLETLLTAQGLRHTYIRCRSGLSICLENAVYLGHSVIMHAVRTSVKAVEDGMAAIIDPCRVIVYPKSRVSEAISCLLERDKKMFSSSDGRVWTAEKLRRCTAYLEGAYAHYVFEDNTLSKKAIRLRGMKMVDLYTTREVLKEGPMLLSEMKRFQSLRLEDWPVVVGQFGGDSTLRHFPAERLLFVPYQTVGTENPVYDAEQTIIEPPSREQYRAHHMKLLGIAPSPSVRNEYFEQFGVTVDKRLSAPSTRLAAPRIRGTVVDPIKRSWRAPMGPYEKGGKLDVFVVLASIPPERSHAVQTTLQQFVKMYVSECNKKGVVIDGKAVIMRPNPTPLEVNRDWMNEMLRATVEKMRKDGETLGRRVTGLVMFIDLAQNRSHDLLKYLERVHEVPTQQIELERAEVVVKKNQMVTMGGMIMKTNKKIGGSNFCVEPADAGAVIWPEVTKDTLIVSADVSRVGRKGEDYEMVPAVVGLASNGMSPDPLAFTGDFSLQAPRQEEIDERVLRPFVQHALKCWSTIRGGRMPSKILYLRDGISDGQIDEVFKEISYIRMAANDTFSLMVGEQPGPVKITAAVVVKRHHLRLVQGEGKDAKNPLPGTLVDSVIVNPQYKDQEFYMQAHKPLKGTARIPLYRFLVNESEYSFDELKSIAHTLCYTHEVCCSPTSIPTPIYIADEYAKRGLNLFRVWRQENPEESVTEESLADLIKRLAYRGTRLQHLRVNA